MYRVLIVDDDRLGRRGIISMMPWEKYGMTVVGEAQNGEKALEFLAENSVDLLFVDLDMPVMNGIALMEKCRVLYPQLFFVVLTFYEDFHYIQSALRIGAIDYISKLQMESTDCDELLKRISLKVEEIMSKHYSKPGEEKRNISKSGPEVTHEVQPFQEEKWQAVVKSWNEMYWLYGDAAFEELCCRTKELDISIWSVAQILLPLTRSAEENICKVQMEVPEYKNLQEFFKWLTSFREILHKKAAGEVNLEKMQLCIMKTVIYVKEHLETPLHAEEIGQIVNLSRSYFSINFKKYTGMAFKEFVRWERIRVAKALLERKDDLVADIAQTVGYEDVNYFIKVFCELTGMTPGEYRKQYIRKDS